MFEEIIINASEMDALQHKHSALQYLHVPALRAFFTCSVNMLCVRPSRLDEPESGVTVGSWDGSGWRYFLPLESLFDSVARLSTKKINPQTFSHHH